MRFAREIVRYLRFWRRERKIPVSLWRLWMQVNERREEEEDDEHDGDEDGRE